MSEPKMTADTNVAFVMALPGWEVLYYFRGGRFETAPVVAWGVTAQEGVFVRATPVTTDLAWSYDDERTICTPDGDVTCGDLERWDSIWSWLDEMKRREAEAPDTLPPERPETAPPSPGKAPIMLENFRRLRQGDTP